MTRLVVRNLSKEFPTRGAPLVVLRDVSLALDSGQNLAVVGPSGSGKTTLLSVLGTLDQPTTGTVQLDDQDLFGLGEPELAALRNRQIGFVFQDHHLLPQCSALENVLVPTLASGPAPRAAADRARQLLQQVGLGDRLAHRPAELSGGERQRVALARALMQEPTLVLADEPTGNLDRSTARRVGQMLVKLVTDERIILVVATHSMELAGTLQRRLLLDDGVLTELGDEGVEGRGVGSEE